MVKFTFFHKIILFFFTISIFILIIFYSNNKYYEKKIYVLTSNKPFYYIAKDIILGTNTINDNHDVFYLYKGKEVDSHLFAFKNTDINKIKKSNVIIYSSIGGDNIFDNLSEVNQTKIDLVKYVDLYNAYNFDNKITSNIDKHFWLLPENGLKIARAITDIMSNIYPDYASFYESNYNDFANKLSSLMIQIEDNFIQNKKISYGIYHDSIRYFTKKYNIAEPRFIFIDGNHNMIPSKELLELMHSMNKGNLECFFDDIDNNILNMINVKNDNIKVINLDINGDYLKESDSFGYIKIIDMLYKNIIQCVQ